MSDENKIEGTINAVTGLVKAVPVYQDALQPAVKELGKGLLTVAKSVNAVLLPLEGLVWGYEKIKGHLSKKLPEKLKDVAPGDIITPKPNVAVPAIEALRYTGDDDYLREMYTDLLASAMNRNTASRALPCFVEIIKQMSSDEAKVLQEFKGRGNHPVVDIMLCENEKHLHQGRMIKKNISLLGEKAQCDFPELSSNYIDNLFRLGLITIPYGMTLTEVSLYEELEKCAQVVKIKQAIEQDGIRKANIIRKVVELTELGKLFIEVCIPIRTYIIKIPSGVFPKNNPDKEKTHD